MPVIFYGNQKIAYRDPACFYADGCYHLFFTLSQKESGYMYNFVAKSDSIDLKNWSKPQILTKKDRTKNFCSPGCVLPYQDQYCLCITSYPLLKPYRKDSIADQTARLYLMYTKDFSVFSEPELIHPKGENYTFEEEGRMIDPFLLENKDVPGEYLLFFKQNGVSLSSSRDLKRWSFCGRAEGGENACVLVRNGEYFLIHSPENGIGMKRSSDLIHWIDLGVTTLWQEESPWADGRLTAGFAMEAKGGSRYRYLLFYHGSRKDCPPETHGAASLALAFTDDFQHFHDHP